MFRPFLVICVLFLLCACKEHKHADVAFYYWKTEFRLSNQQKALLKQSNAETIYIRYFDVKWDAVRKRAYPDAIVRFDEKPSALKVVPVIYITNRTFEQMPLNGIDSLAGNCKKLLNRISSGDHIKFQKIQIDCDWTLKTKVAYFAFLTALKKNLGCKLEATIRLHQIKYGNLTGVPPVDGGVLMFYNMGKLNASLKQPNSIYNSADAQRYLNNIKLYPLPLDVALPAFSWAIHIRNGKMIQVYQKISRSELSTANFESVNELNAFRARKSFYMAGIYIKQNDIFKLEETDAKLLEAAGGQLAESLSAQRKRTVIFYELANIKPSVFTAQTINQVSANF